jgi:hypothetical protein
VFTGVAAIAIGVQLVAILVPFTQNVYTYDALTGYPLYQQRAPGQVPNVPFGRDPNRWIPELSPLYLQSTMLASRIGTVVGTGPITLTYHPFEGAKRTLTLSDGFMDKAGFDGPDFWWLQEPVLPERLFALLVAGVAIASGLILTRVARGRVESARAVPA